MKRLDLNQSEVADKKRTYREHAVRGDLELTETQKMFREKIRTLRARRASLLSSLDEKDSEIARSAREYFDRKYQNS